MARKAKLKFRSNFVRASQFLIDRRPNRSRQHSSTLARPEDIVGSRFFSYALLATFSATDWVPFAGACGCDGCRVMDKEARNGNKNSDRNSRLRQQQR